MARLRQTKILNYLGINFFLNEYKLIKF
jgi:hypothetical protein